MRYALPITAPTPGALLACSSATPTAEQPAPAVPPTKAPELTSASLDLSPVSVAVPDTPLPTNWAQGAVFIRIYVRGYKDSDGDGIGDFKGLTQQLDYLQALGVQGIWLMPINQVQDHDHGYAVTDYRKLESDYGSEADFKAFLAAAHAKASGSSWTMSSTTAPTRTRCFSTRNKLNGKRDWYVWMDHDPGWVNWDQSASWHKIKPTKDHYYGVFWEQMPDFNLKRIRRFWPTTTTTCATG